MSTPFVNKFKVVLTKESRQTVDVRKFYLYIWRTSMYAHLRKKIRTVFPSLHNNEFAITWYDGYDFVSIDSEPELFVAMNELRSKNWRYLLYVQEKVQPQTAEVYRGPPRRHQPRQLVIEPPLDLRVYAQGPGTENAPTHPINAQQPEEENSPRGPVVYTQRTGTENAPTHPIIYAQQTEEENSPRGPVVYTQRMGTENAPTHPINAQQPEEENSPRGPVVYTQRMGTENAPTHPIIYAQQSEEDNSPRGPVVYTQRMGTENAPTHPIMYAQQTEVENSPRGPVVYTQRPGTENVPTMYAQEYDVAYYSSNPGIYTQGPGTENAPTHAMTYAHGWSTPNTPYQTSTSLSTHSRVEPVPASVTREMLLRKYGLPLDPSSSDEAMSDEGTGGGNVIETEGNITIISDDDDDVVKRHGDRVTDDIGVKRKKNPAKLARLVNNGV